MHIVLAYSYAFDEKTMREFADENDRSRTGNTGEDILQRGTWVVSVLAVLPYMIFTIKGTT